MDIRELKSLKNSEDIQSGVNSLMRSKDSDKRDVNEWLYLYECVLYPRAIDKDCVDLVLLGTAIALLQFLQYRFPKSSSSFLVQEMNLRTRAIRCSDTTEESELLDPRVVINEFYKHSKNYTPDLALQATSNTFEALKESKEPALINTLRELRRIKSLLGPIEILKGIGISIPSDLNDWLAVRGKLP